MQTQGWYQHHLNQVSRSFAFCIEKLEQPLRLWVSQAYLLCRMLDCIEDASWPLSEKGALQARHFRAFSFYLNAFTPELRERVRAWANEFPESLPPGERELLAQSVGLFEDFHELPAPVREAIRIPVLRMAEGMRLFAEEAGGEAVRLKSLREVNRYCFVVAGVVGELLTRLLVLATPRFRVPDEMLTRACSFGLFLQKVNLLKDQRTDQIEGRFLVHDRAEVWSSLGADSQGAFEYLVSIPREARGFRVFCAWSLYLGLASLSWIERAWRGENVKIPRATTEALLREVEEAIEDDSKLRKFHEKAHRILGLRALPSSAPAGECAWIEGLAAGFLNREQLVGLQII